MNRSPLLGYTVALLAMGIAALAFAALELGTAVTVTLPQAIQGGGDWECGSLWSFLVHNNTGFNGGEWSSELREYVLAQCPPAAERAKISFVGAVSVGAAALLGAVIVFLVHLRRTRAAASV